MKGKECATITEDILKIQEDFIKTYGSRVGDINFRLYCIRWYPTTSEGYGDISSLENLLQAYDIRSLVSEARTNEFMYAANRESTNYEVDRLIEAIVHAYRVLPNLKKLN